MSALTPLQRYLLNPAEATHALLERLRDAFAATAPWVIDGLGDVHRDRSLTATSRTNWPLQRRLTRDARFVAILAPPDADRARAEVLWSNLVALLRPWGQRGPIFGQPHLKELRVPLVERGIGHRPLGSALRAARPRRASGRVGLAGLPNSDDTPGAADPVGSPQPPAERSALLVPSGSRSKPGTTSTRSERYSVGRDTWESTEHAAVQVLARPATGRRVARCLRAAEAVRKGRSASIVARALDLLSPRAQSATRNMIDLSAAQDVRLILNKAASPLYEVLVRYAVASGATDGKARRVLRGRAHGIASAFAVFTGRNLLARRRLRHLSHVMTQRRMGRGDLLSVPELAVIAHLPTDRAVPGLARAGARSWPPPPRIPTAGKLLGDFDAGILRPVALGVVEARYHVHVMGATGTGKSTLLTNLIVDDVAAGRGWSPSTPRVI